MTLNDRERSSFFDILAFDNSSPGCDDSSTNTLTVIQAHQQKQPPCRGVACRILKHHVRLYASAYSMTWCGAGKVTREVPVGSSGFCWNCKVAQSDRAIQLRSHTDLFVVVRFTNRLYQPPARLPCMHTSNVHPPVFSFAVPDRRSLRCARPIACACVWAKYELVQFLCADR